MGALLITHRAAPITSLTMGAVHLGRRGHSLGHAPRSADHVLDDEAVHPGRRGHSLGHAPRISITSLAMGPYTKAIGHARRCAEHVLGNGTVHVGGPWHASWLARGGFGRAVCRSSSSRARAWLANRLAHLKISSKNCI